MKDEERTCSKCGKIFVVREIDGTRDSDICYIHGRRKKKGRRGQECLWMTATGLS